MPRQHGIPGPFPDNGELAKFGADVMDALSEYPDMPLVDSVTVSHGGIPLIGLSAHNNDVPLAHARWAAALGHVVVVDSRERSFGLDRLRTDVMLRGIHCTFEDPISTEDAARCLSTIEEVPEPGRKWTINGAQLLSALESAAVSS